jgi:iron complex outermembrane receptor protein
MKSKMKPSLTPIAGAVSVLVAMVAMPAYAQDAGQQVTVTGIRASLQNAVNIKRNSTAVVDAVSAEDVGKLPDADVGESLGRIPGVSVGRAFGQGASVSVRGSDPQMTYTTLNGQTVASTGWYDQLSIDRSFNYSLLPAELIGGMEVYKSSQADLTEGGIGGTVIVRTRKPLDLKANTIFAGVGVGRGTVSDDLLKEVSGLYSWRTQEKTFGVLVGGAVEEGDYIRRGVEADTRWASDVAPTTFVQERKRKALNVNLQARPMTGMTFGLNLLSLKLDGDNSNTSHYIFPDANCTERNTAVTSAFNPTGVCLKSTTTAATSTDAFVQTWARQASMKSDSAAFDFSFKGNGVKVDAVAGVTKAKGGTSMTTNYSYGSWTVGSSLPDWTGTIDATGKQISINPASDQSVTLANLPASTGPAGAWATSRGPNSDREKFAQADVTLDLDWGVLNSFKTGVRFADHTFKAGQDRAVFAATPIETATAGLYDGTIDMGTLGWSHPKPNIDGMMANTTANITNWVENRSAYTRLNEKNQALYGMFNFEKDELSGNFGVRYIRTKAISEGYDFNGTPLDAAAVAAGTEVAQNTGWGRNIASDKATYNDVLPSLNLAVKLRNDLTMRFTAAQALTRPNFANMFRISQSGYGDDRTGNETITYGSVGLKPMKSSQFDLGLEYYYGKANLISLMYFHKDINNFITTQTTLNQSIGVADPAAGDNWTVARFVNAGGGEIDGIEAQINHAFAGGFGIVANYTFAEAKAPGTSYDDQLNVFTQSSKHNANLVGYWENDTFSTRVAYNWRSKYMIRENPFWYGNRMHDDYGTLDASFGWNIGDKFRLQFEANNLTKEDDVQYGAAAGNAPNMKDPLKMGYPAWSFKGETTYKLRFTAKF